MKIESKDNPKIKHLKKLYSSRKARDKESLFVIEGVRGCVDAVMGELADGNVVFEIEGIFYTEKSVRNYEEYLPTYLFDNMPESKKFEITEDLAAKISDTSTSQGVFVVAKKTDKAFDDGVIKSEGKYIILDNLQDPGNLGTMLRTSDAVGVDGVILTGECVDLYNPKVVRSAVGSLPRVNIYIEKDYERVLSAFKCAGIKTAAAVVSGGISITDYDFSKGCAVVIGNEGRGLADDRVKLCDDKVTIQMRGHMDSLNAAVAGTIFLWEMMKK